MFHLLTYYLNAAAAAADSDMAAAIDTEFSQRNSHYVFSEPYRLLATYHLATSATRARITCPTWNAVARFVLDPPTRANTVGSGSRMMDLTHYTHELPLNEEIAVECSNDLAEGNEDTTVHLWISSPDWSRNIPRGRQLVVARFTSAVAGIADSWSGIGAITFAENLRGGVYSVIGAEVFDAGSRAFRLNFPRSPSTRGRRFRPGALCREAIGDIPVLPTTYGPLFFGLWGRFHTFEPPQIEIWANATAASAQEGRMWLVYEGENVTI